MKDAKSLEKALEKEKDKVCIEIIYANKQKLALVCVLDNPTDFENWPSWKSFYFFSEASSYFYIFYILFFFRGLVPDGVSRSGTLT